MKKIKKAILIFIINSHLALTGLISRSQAYAFKIQNLMLFSPKMKLAKLKILP